MGSEKVVGSIDYGSPITRHQEILPRETYNDRNIKFHSPNSRGITERSLMSMEAPETPLPPPLHYAYPKTPTFFNEQLDSSNDDITIGHSPSAFHMCMTRQSSDDSFTSDNNDFLGNSCNNNNFYDSVCTVPPLHTYTAHTASTVNINTSTTDSFTTKEVIVNNENDHRSRRNGMILNGEVDLSHTRDTPCFTTAVHDHEVHRGGGGMYARNSNSIECSDRSSTMPPMSSYHLSNATLPPSSLGEVKGPRGLSNSSFQHNINSNTNRSKTSDDIDRKTNLLTVRRGQKLTRNLTLPRTSTPVTKVSCNPHPNPSHYRTPQASLRYTPSSSTWNVSERAPPSSIEKLKDKLKLTLPPDTAIPSPRSGCDPSLRVYLSQHLLQSHDSLCSNACLFGADK